MTRLFKMIKDPPEGTPVQFLAVYATHWRPEWGDPEYAFVETEDEDLYEECARILKETQDD